MLCFSFTNVGAMCTQLALYDRALECHRKALNVKLILLGANSLDTAISYAWIGMTLQKQGDQVGAIEYYQKALVIRQAALDLTIVAVTYVHIARLSFLSFSQLSLTLYLGDCRSHALLGQYGKCKELCKQANTTFKVHLNPSHFRVGQVSPISFKF